MKVFRIASKEFVNDLSGTGAKLYGGRWNEKGTPLLYCAENISLAILEILVHFDGLTVPKNLKLLTLEFSNKEVIEFSKAKFNKIRKSKNAEFLFKDEGQKWAKSNKSLVLKVPSIITKDEFNYLINPNHQNSNKIKKGKIVDLDLDSRLFKMKSDS